MMEVQKILVPVDFSECSRVALRYAVHFGNRLGAATIDVLHVWQPPAYLDPGIRLHTPEGREETLAEFVRSKAGQSMKAFLAEVEGGGSFAVHGRLESGEPREAILAAAGEGYDLIVMGTRGEATNVKLGSIAQKVVRNASCPVLTIRA
jgi:nucleotide-binding universal stress UspA family protein